MSSGFSSFDGMLEDFDNKDPKVSLDGIISALRRSQKKDLPHEILFLFLIPGALILWRITDKLTRTKYRTESFEPLIQRDLTLTVVATVIYVVMWLYLLPTIAILWNLFHTADWEYFFNSFFRWNTFQAILLVLIQVFFSKLAINSFELTKTFWERYESLEELAKTKYSNSIIAEQARNRVLEIVPEIMQTLIHQSITAMIASGELNSASAQEMTRIMKEITRNVLLNVDDFDRFYPTASDSAIEVREDIVD